MAHLFIGFFLSLSRPLGVMVWLRPLIGRLPGLFIQHFSKSFFLFCSVYRHQSTEAEWAYSFSLQIENRSYFYLIWYFSIQNCEIYSAYASVGPFVSIFCSLPILGLVVLHVFIVHEKIQPGNMLNNSLKFSGTKRSDQLR